MKNLLFGLGAAVIALSMSAFTEVSKQAQGDVYVYNGTNYVRIADPESYDPDLCTSNPQQCAFEQTGTGTFDPTLTPATISASPAFTELGTKTGIYSGL